MRQQKQQRLIVRNLNFHAKEEDLARAFSEFGPLAEVRGAGQGRGKGKGKGVDEPARKQNSGGQVNAVTRLPVARSVLYICWNNQNVLLQEQQRQPLERTTASALYARCFGLSY